MTEGKSKKVVINNASDLERHLQALLTWQRVIFKNNLNVEPLRTSTVIVDFRDALSEEKKYKEYAEEMFKDKDNKVSNFIAHSVHMDGLELGYLYDFCLWTQKISEKNLKVYYN